MTRLLLLLCACLAAICEAALLAPPAFSSRQSLAGRAPSTRASLVERLRGGAADEDEDEDEDGDELDEELEGGGEEVAVDDDGPSLANPFLGGGGGAGGLGGLSEITKSLQDPATLQKALKELQDPATQERFKQMMEDPAFLESMKAYAEQLTKDPMFDQLKEQAEKMMSDPAFMEEMQKAMADPSLMGALAGMGGAPGGAGSDEEDGDE
ncbi:hypothetical protein EMIHUDRAFT_431908 [Emiliania huxleyi CCMP1516]|uniref:STI1 domain-containing protein n=2 Tax=Emiliania huxleyi TaxID=2903 RepID=A0A0D3L1Z7_EMIH1|nr:hypothetical protein EMIHUDRAFT_445580 [Emiliania huxleyi CCMP1516]XP_005794461.1 hypothetical protein EMIHUDRAFT_431908 [Emiliania huxleyi CCMP1516]EOD15505.1 hypothetical protein EMIHUDRAFT_445580 [Emiliania huxleyi CCMP1516]EOD42032.1 hypothetical protein EMIHUDRAFT_431908 [Emiliania huxleyi CCMP1516]|mmetsp:Transcript_39933/g.128393  ORF Transcript_39933/g.128393 Transcript_39933/m.128393 type:complete len:210 (-) Transcript_39933:190-819(-)|eukprot:XP_005767934.1 hypothetical protein EMIHUDRAFT_445580 [Emiliania huxleyi CCMP1516]